MKFSSFAICKMHAVKIHFLGASGTVTGSKFYLETSELNIMVDCGTFQGLKELRQKNWKPLPINVSKTDVVLLTHGHLDHTGYLPRLLKYGFKGTIIGTPPTLAIASIILMDSAKIHEEEAERANTEGYSEHLPALPFYTIKEAKKTIEKFQEKNLNQWFSLAKNIKFRFRYNAHILGASFIELDIFGKIFIFSGDIGRHNDKLLAPPNQPKWADFLFLESTYGNKLHPNENVDDIIAKIIENTIHKNGCLIIPSFAIERMQTLMHILWQLYLKNKIPNIPVFIDSPMGNNVLKVFEKFPNWHKLSITEYFSMKQHFNIIESYADTWKTIDDLRPKIVIAGSGMVTGGRVLTYLKQLIDKSNTTILLVGYQAEGTRGRQLLDGAHELKIFGKYLPVRAQIKHLQSLSSHADQNEILSWIGGIKNNPQSVFLIHGEPTALDTLRVKIKDVFGWPVYIPKLNEVKTILV